MKALSSFSHVIAILLIVFVCSTAAPILMAIPDMYEVRHGGYALERHYDSISGRQWTTQVSLEKLEVVLNDMAYGMPLESCIEEKMTGDNKYTLHAGQNSKFEEVHEVQFIFITISIIIEGFHDFGTKIETALQTCPVVGRMRGF